MWRSVALVLLCLFTFVFGLGQPAIQDSDEAFYAEAGREMVASGDWTTPHYNFEPRLQKPVLMYWLIAATYTATGVSEWGARIWSALAGMGLALLAALVARRWSGPNEGLLAGGIVATSFGVVPLARQSLPDMPLAFFVSVSIWAAVEAVSSEAVAVEVSSTSGPRQRFSLSRQAWLYLSAAAAALGMLAKGPVAVVLPVTVVVPLVWWEVRRRPGGLARVPISARHVAVAAALFALIAAPWYLAVVQAQGTGYVRQFFVGENVERFATSSYNQWRGWFYGPVIVAGLLPWSAFGLLWFGRLTEWWKGQRPMTPLEARLIAWTLGPLIFYMLSVGSQPRYILPCLVPLSILLARSIWRHASGGAGPRRAVSFTAAGVAAGGAIVLVGVLLWRAASTFSAAGYGVSSSGPLAIAIIGLAVVLVAFVLPRRVMPAAVAAAAAAVLLVFHGSLLAPGRPEPVEVVAAAIRAENGAAAVCACGAFARSLNFYTGSRVEIANVTGDYTDELRRFLENPARVLAAADARALERLETSLGRRFPRITEVTYLNTSVWQRGETLAYPDPALVQRVVLIANR